MKTGFGTPLSALLLAAVTSTPAFAGLNGAEKLFKANLGKTTSLKNTVTGGTCTLEGKRDTSYPGAEGYVLAVDFDASGEGRKGTFYGSKFKGVWFEDAYRLKDTAYDIVFHKSIETEVLVTYKDEKITGVKRTINGKLDSDCK